MKKIYIITTYTGTTLSYLIRNISKTPYAHVSIALSEDLKQIEEDWNLIVNKIRAGKAHEISAADTRPCAIPCPLFSNAYRAGS
jgi:hypothetical protein